MQTDQKKLEVTIKILESAAYKIDDKINKTFDSVKGRKLRSESLLCKNTVTYLQRIINLGLIMSIIFFCNFTYALPNGTCEIDVKDGPYDGPYYGPGSEYGDFHLGWYDPDLFIYEAMMYSNQKYDVCEDWCDPIVLENIEFIADKYLWNEIVTTQGETARLSCGGDAKCDEPLLKPNVKCQVEESDCNGVTWDESYNAPYFTLIRTYELECRGDVNCQLEHKSPKDCCVVTKVIENRSVNFKNANVN